MRANTCSVDTLDPQYESLLLDIAEIGIDQENIRLHIAETSRKPTTLDLVP